MKRQVVTIPFPFSDLSGVKRRPALVIADWGGDDVVLCQITTKTKADGFEVSLDANEFENGSLPIPSNIRPNKIFTAEKATLLSVKGTISETKYKEVYAVLTKLFA